MYGDDIIYWTDSIAKLLTIGIFSGIKIPKQFRRNPIEQYEVKFWLDLD